MAKGLSPWIKHVMETKRKMGSGTSLGAAMKKAKGTYKHKRKGGALERPEGPEGSEGMEEEEGAAKELGAEAEFEEEKGGRRRKTRRHRGGRTRRTRRHR